MAGKKIFIVLFTCLLFALVSCSVGGGGGGGGDTEAPVITVFTGPGGVVNVSTIDITLEGSDNESITGWLVGFSSDRPGKNDLGWREGKPTTFSLGAPGAYTLYAWAKDAAGNVSAENANSRIDINADFACKEWTIIIHFAVDNNIDSEFEENFQIVSNYLSTLETVKANDIADKINILILMDGDNKEANFQDGYYCLSGGVFANNLVVSKAEINSGSLEDTRDFLDWVVANYPAEKYMYSVFNHGGGFDDVAKNGDYASPRGIAYDDSSNDCLSHYELGQATSYLKNEKIGGKIELFYAFACLMGGMELAYEIKDNANYLLFSEETFPADYWSYEALDSILDDPDITGGEIGTAFCDSAADFFNVEKRDFTLSVIDLAEVNDLALALDVYATLAMADINGSANASSYNNAVDSSLTFTTAPGYTNYYYADLGDYLAHIAAGGAIGADVKAQALLVGQALADCVVYKSHRGFALASGMTIYHNIWDSLWYYGTTLYRSLFTFGADNNWADYIALMNSKSSSAIKPDAYEPDQGQASARSLPINGSKQRHTFHTTSDIDLLKVVLQSGTSYKIETYPVSGQTQCDTRLFLVDIVDNVLIALASNDDKSISSYYSKATYDCLVSGTYYIYVDCLEWPGYGTGVYDVDIRSGNYSLSNPDNPALDGTKKDGNTEKKLEDLKNRLKQLKE